MTKPPNALNPVPNRVTPPFVPGGTFFPVVIKIGWLLESIPNSDANVSARLVAWCATRAHASDDASGYV